MEYELRKQHPENSMDNESEAQNADDDKIHEDLLNRAVAQFSCLKVETWM